ncbi:hypothetical protein GCM10022232_91940 [Streptomyces plumbiresistens]|uniref:Tn3 transposase DDE domain-containing protein n=1 Tax=Streptomyces plumbiresistens TaxID=511811 RepID=A0ABP7TUV3_9ACTN
MGVSGAEEDGRATLRGCLEPLGERIQSNQGPLRINHIMALNVTRIGRNPALVRHQLDQIQLSPRPLGINPDQYPRIPSSEQPITPQTLLPRGRHSPGQPRGKQMGTQGADTQHGCDADGPNTPPRHERANTPQLA